MPAGSALLLARSRRDVIAGLALAMVATLAWVAAAGYGYGLGFVGAAEGTRAAIETGRALPFRLWLALGVIAGGAAFGERRMRMPPTDVPPPGGPAWNPDAPNDLGTARR